MFGSGLNVLSLEKTIWHCRGTVTRELEIDPVAMHSETSVDRCHSNCDSGSEVTWKRFQSNMNEYEWMVAWVSNLCYPATAKPMCQNLSRFQRLNLLNVAPRKHGYGSRRRSRGRGGLGRGVRTKWNAYSNFGKMLELVDPLDPQEVCLQTRACSCSEHYGKHVWKGQKQVCSETSHFSAFTWRSITREIWKRLWRKRRNHQCWSKRAWLPALLRRESWPGMRIYRRGLPLQCCWRDSRRGNSPVTSCRRKSPKKELKVSGRIQTSWHQI